MRLPCRCGVRRLPCTGAGREPCATGSPARPCSAPPRTIWPSSTPTRRRKPTLTACVRASHPRRGLSRHAAPCADWRQLFRLHDDCGVPIDHAAPSGETTLSLSCRKGRMADVEAAIARCGLSLWPDPAADFPSSHRRRRFPSRRPPVAPLLLIPVQGRLRGVRRSRGAGAHAVDQGLRVRPRPAGGLPAGSGPGPGGVHTGPGRLRHERLAVVRHTHTHTPFPIDSRVRIQTHSSCRFPPLYPRRALARGHRRVARLLEERLEAVRQRYADEEAMARSIHDCTALLESNTERCVAVSRRLDARDADGLRGLVGDCASRDTLRDSAALLQRDDAVGWAEVRQHHERALAEVGALSSPGESAAGVVFALDLESSRRWTPLLLCVSPTSRPVFRPTPLTTPLCAAAVPFPAATTRSSTP